LRLIKKKNTVHATALYTGGGCTSGHGYDNLDLSGIRGWSNGILAIVCKIDEPTEVGPLSNGIVKNKMQLRGTVNAEQLSKARSQEALCIVKALLGSLFLLRRVWKNRVVDPGMREIGGHLNLGNRNKTHPRIF